MDELTEGSKLLYQLSAAEAESINAYIVSHPDQHAPGTQVTAGQRLWATAVLSRGRGGAGPERLAVRLDGGATDVDKNYHVWASDLQYANGAWHTPAPGPSA